MFSVAGLKLIRAVPDSEIREIEAKRMAGR
jgi:hypothetical protein